MHRHAVHASEYLHGHSVHFRLAPTRDCGQSQTTAVISQMIAPYIATFESISYNFGTMEVARFHVAELSKLRLILYCNI